mgnify:CR=1 FL=1
MTRHLRQEYSSPSITSSLATFILQNVDGTMCGVCVPCLRRPAPNQCLVTSLTTNWVGRGLLLLHGSLLQALPWVVGQRVRRCVGRAVVTVPGRHCDGSCARACPLRGSAHLALPRAVGVFSHGDFVPSTSRAVTCSPFHMLQVFSRCWTDFPPVPSFDNHPSYVRASCGCHDAVCYVVGLVLFAQWFRSLPMRAVRFFFFCLIQGNQLRGPHQLHRCHMPKWRCVGAAHDTLP